MRSFFVWCCILCAFSVLAQQDEEDKSPRDSISTPRSGRFPAGKVRSDTLPVKRASQRGDIETTINYNARDSIFIDLRKQNLQMYGETHIDYGDITLEAERTDVNMHSKTIRSLYKLDSAGRKIGKPVFSDQQDVYETDFIIYNFTTERAQIRGVVTEQQGAIMHGEDVRKNEKDEMFIRGARYTTCNLSDPHFFIESKKLKVIPNNKVVSGPFQLKFREVGTPLMGPFGMFPQPKRRASGIIFPSYGEERRRGFFLRNGGYYFAFNDYVDLRATGDIYTKGTTGLTINSNYKKRYKFSGSMNFSYNRNVTDDLENPLKTNDFWYRWNHRQESRGTGNFSASVSLGTSTFNENSNLVTQDFNRSIRSQYSSNVSYSKRFQGTPFNMTLNASQRQNIQTGIMTLGLPDFSFNTSRQYPFKKYISNSRNPIANISFSHNFSARNELTNAARSGLPFQLVNENTDSQDTLEFNFENLPDIMDRSRSGGRHTVPISTSISLLKHFTLSPTFNYQEVWYMRELDFTYVPEEEAVRVDTVDGFSRAASWSSGASLNTVIYGTHFFSGKGKVQAIRHVITPSVSFSYNPDFGDPSQGIYQYVQTNENGDSTRVSKYQGQGFIYGSPTGNKNRSLSFSLQNNLEMKVRDDEDSTGDGFKKVKVFDNLSLSSGYNFAADSFQLAPMRFQTRTSFFDNAINLALSGTIDPYVYELLSETTTASGDRRVTQRRVDLFTWDNGQGFGNLSQLTTAVSFRLQGKRNKNDNSEEVQDDQSLDTRFQEDDPFNARNQFGNTQDGMVRSELEYMQRNPDEYVDFNVPWNLNVSYNITRRQAGFEEPNIRQTLTFSGNLSITPKTKVTFNSGYDMEKKEFTQTKLGVVRDLHCWGLTFNWVPFGRFQSFSIVIQPNAAMLQDLKLQRRRSFIDFFAN